MGLYSSVKSTMPMKYSNLSVHIASMLKKKKIEFEDWMVLCLSIWLARNHTIHNDAISEPQEIVAKAENVVNSFRGYSAKWQQ